MPIAHTKPPRRFASFEDFWAYYLGEHGSAANRGLHIAGLGAGLALAGVAVVRRRPVLLLAALLAGYGPAWLGHFLIERNRPATFGNALWSVRADLRMLFFAARGHLGGELRRCGVTPVPRRPPGLSGAGGPVTR